MLIGPVFHRELAIAPRRRRLYFVRAGYAAALLVLVFTAWLVLTGTQLVRDAGDLARFGGVLFQILAPLQLALAVFFSAIFSAASVAQEKDRRTLILLLLTHLTNSELVLGKLFAGLLQVLVMLLAGLPIFMLVAMLGGVSFDQIARVFAVTLFSIVACGSLGSTLALWREKTFQALAMTVLALVLWLALGEAVAAGALGRGWLGLSHTTWAVAISPWQAILEAARPQFGTAAALGPFRSAVDLFLAFAAGATLILNAVAIARVRVWNPPRAERAMRRAVEEAQVETAAEVVHAEPRAARWRPVWDNPVLWREMRTWAYGRKTLVIRLAYLLLFAISIWAIRGLALQGAAASSVAAAAVPLLFLSLVLVNAQAVTALTSERDVGALDILLVTDLTPREIVFGKLGGVFYNTKEMVLLPLLLCGYLSYLGALSAENACYLVGGLAVLYAFVAMVGVHAGMIHANSRQAVAVSLGTVFFLFLGVATCMRIMVSFSGSFHAQLLPFTALFVVGGVGLYLALGARNPSSAIALASFLCPFASFYAITSLLLGASLGVFLVIAGAFGFATAAMLVPALGEFDVATGKASADE